MGFPTRENEAALHERVLANDPVAPVDVFEAFVGPLAAVVERDLRSDPEVARDASIDAIFEYLGSPHTFQDEKGRLGTFLAQIAKRKAIDAHRARSAEVRREHEFSSAVELRALAPNVEMEHAAEAYELWRKIEQAVQSERDRTALVLILDGERSTDALAEALGLDGLSQMERRREVKRHRDRLVKVLERLGAKLRDEEGS